MCDAEKLWTRSVTAGIVCGWLTELSKALASIFLIIHHQHRVISHLSPLLSRSETRSPVLRGVYSGPVLIHVVPGHPFRRIPLLCLPTRRFPPVHMSPLRPDVLQRSYPHSCVPRY